MIMLMRIIICGLSLHPDGCKHNVPGKKAELLRKQTGFCMCISTPGTIAQASTNASSSLTNRDMLVAIGMNVNDVFLKL